MRSPRFVRPREQSSAIIRLCGRGLCALCFRSNFETRRLALVKAPAVRSLVELLAVNDPHTRLVATLERLDSAITAARMRVRCWGGDTYPDPDSHAIGKLEEYAQAMIREYHAARASSVADIAAQTRLEAIAELEAVIAAWRDVSDAQWLASRGVRTPAPTVVRRKRAGTP